MPIHAALTRRSLIAGSIAASLCAGRPAAQSGTPEATPAAFAWPTPVDIGDGLEVRDWRLSIDQGPSRFMVELYNASADIMVSPTVGIVLPHTDTDHNYGWADPFTPVIHPGQSTFLVGMTPGAVREQANLDAAEWVYCDPDEENDAILADLEDLDYEVESETVVHRPDWMECAMTVRNLGTKPIWSMRLAGIVRDADGRICGGTAYSTLSNIEGGETLEMAVHVRPAVEMTASPFAFVGDLTGGSATFSVQPRGKAVNPGCPAVMPWNR